MIVSSSNADFSWNWKYNFINVFISLLSPFGLDCALAPNPQSCKLAPGTKYFCSTLELSPAGQVWTRTWAWSDSFIHLIFIKLKYIFCSSVLQSLHSNRIENTQETDSFIHYLSSSYCLYFMYCKSCILNSFSKNKIHPSGTEYSKEKFKHLQRFFLFSYIHAQVCSVYKWFLGRLKI